MGCAKFGAEVGAWGPPSGAESGGCSGRVGGGGVNWYKERILFLFIRPVGWGVSCWTPNGEGGARFCGAVGAAVVW